MAHSNQQHRAAALNYFVLPVKFSRVLIAKNITAVTLGKLAACYAVTGVMTLLLLAVGNLGSVYYPRPVNPGTLVAFGFGRPVPGVLDVTLPAGGDSGDSRLADPHGPDSGRGPGSGLDFSS